MAVADTTFPVQRILEKYNEKIQNYVELVILAKALTTNHSQVFSFAVFTDITNTVRTKEQNVGRLLQVVQARGLQGFVKFVTTLLNDRFADHVTLGRLLLDEVQKVFQEKDGEFPKEERALLIELLNTLDPVKPPSSLGTSEEIPRRARAIRRVLDKHFKQLEQEIQLANLRSYLLKHAVLTSGEFDELMDFPPEQRNEGLLRKLTKKSNAAVIAFHRCLKESSKHAKLAELFDLDMENPKEEEEEEEEKEEEEEYMGHIELPLTTTTDKMAVFLCMDEYIRLTDDSRAVKFSLPSINKGYKQNRDKLQSCLTVCGYEVMNLGELFVKEEASCEDIRPRKELLLDLYRKYVVNRCVEQGTVFFYITGLAYPAEKIAQDQSSERQLSEKMYSGAILLQGAPEICRRPVESISVHDLNQWVELLPTPLATMLIDCHTSHTALYARQQKPKESYILEFPWKELTKWNSRTVVYSLSPEKRAILHIPPKDVTPEHAFGLLTDRFVKVFDSWIRRGKPTCITHRLFYEQLSYLWNGRQRAHLLFSPSIQGDMDRTFLGGDGYPYRQWLRADLISTKPPSLPRQRFDLDRVHIRTSKMAGLIVDDMLDVFHICRPEEVFKGKVVEAHQMCAIFAMENVEALAKLLEEEYQGIPAGPDTDSSMYFLCLRKTFPLHLKENYTVHLDQSLGEDDIAKLKLHIDTSPLLTAVPSLKVSKMEVKREGQAYTIEDRDGDVVHRPKVKNIVHVSSLLEMMAWFKFVKSIRPNDQSQATNSCYLTRSADQPLLLAGLKSGVTIEASSHKGEHPVSAAIISFGENPLFWEPDSNAYLRINLAYNHVITALEIRGDAAKNSYARELGISYRKILFSKTYVYGTDALELPAGICAYIVSLQPCESVDKGFEFRLRFISKQGTAVTFDGGKEEVKWACQAGSSPVSEFRLDVPTGLARLELKGGAKGLRVKVALHSSLTPYFLASKTNLLYSSAWPKRHQFDTPIVASLIELRPIYPPSGPAPVSMQVQLYGVKEGTILEVEEKDKLVVHFTNENERPVFVYVFCLEETGMVQFVLSEYVFGRTTESATIKKFISTSFPKGHNVPAITDMYKVFVSQKMMYLEPYIQRGLHEHFCPLRYDVCSYGAGVMDKRDRWDQYEFKVRIRKPTH